MLPSYAKQYARSACLPPAIAVPDYLAGGFAEYVALPERFLFKVPRELTDDQAISISPFSIALQAVEVSQVQAGGTALVIGGGAIGLVVVGTLRFIGVTKIIVSDLLTERHPLAFEFGADVALDPTEHALTGEVKALTGGQKVMPSSRRWASRKRSSRRLRW